MKMRWTSAVLPFAAAAVMTACNGSTDRVSNKGQASGNDQTAKNATLTLSGCVEAAAGTNQYVLRNVRMAPLAEQASDAPSTQGFTITEGSYVKLSASDDDDLKNALGKEVTVIGSLRDDGRNTIGTSGEAKGPDEAGNPSDNSHAAKDESQAHKVQHEAGPIGQQSNWNGNAPELAVNRVTATGKPCAATQGPERR